MWQECRRNEVISVTFNRATSTGYNWQPSRDVVVDEGTKGDSRTMLLLAVTPRVNVNCDSESFLTHTS